MSSIEEDLPDGWATATLGDVTIPKVAQGNDEGPLTYVDIGSVDNSSKRVTEPKSLTKGDKIPSRARQRLATNDVIVSMTRPNLNAVALIPEELNDSIGSTGFDVLRCVQMEPTWLFNIVRSKQFVDSMSAIVQGALYPAVRPGDIRKYEIPVPPIAEQRRIVAKIEALQERSRKARELLTEVGPPPSEATSPPTGASKTPTPNPPPNSWPASAPNAVKNGKTLNSPSTKPKVKPRRRGGRTSTMNRNQLHLKNYPSYVTSRYRIDGFGLLLSSLLSRMRTSSTASSNQVRN